MHLRSRFQERCNREVRRFRRRTGPYYCRRRRILTNRGKRFPSLVRHIGRHSIRLSGVAAIRPAKHKKIFGSTSSASATCVSCLCSDSASLPSFRACRTPRNAAVGSGARLAAHRRHHGHHQLHRTASVARSGFSSFNFFRIPLPLSSDLIDLKRRFAFAGDRKRCAVSCNDSYSASESMTTA